MALIQALGLSERRACRLIRQPRSTQRYSSVASDDGALRDRMKALADRHRRFGHPRLHILLRRDGFGANHKKTHRIYTRWVQADSYATTAEYTIHHNGGSATTVVNQQHTGGQWVALGAYDLVPGQDHKVELRQLGTNQQAVADAMRFVRVGDIKLVTADAVRFVKNNAEPVSYLLWDHLYTPKKLVNNTGTVTWDASLTPYGAMDSQLGAAVQALRLPGQYVDEETGRGTSGLTHPLYYNYHRDYDPTLGRYIQADPIGLAGGYNLYRYANANPVGYVDPDGQSPKLAYMAGGADWRRHVVLRAVRRARWKSILHRLVSSRHGSVSRCWLRALCRARRRTNGCRWVASRCRLPS